MDECYEFYQDYRYDIPTLLSITNFIKRNNVDEKDIVTVLRTANDVVNLNQTYSNRKAEIEKLKQTRNNYSLNQNTMRSYQLPPLGPLPGYYNWLLLRKCLFYLHITSYNLYNKRDTTSFVIFK